MKQRQELMGGYIVWEPADTKPGSMFRLTTPAGTKADGYYVYDGAQWLGPIATQEEAQRAQSFVIDKPLIRSSLAPLMHLLRGACTHLPQSDPLWRNLHRALSSIEDRLGEPRLFPARAERREMQRQ